MNPMDDVVLMARAKYHPRQEELAEPVHAEYQKDQLEKLEFLNQPEEITTNQTEELEHLQTIVLGEQMDHKIAM
jgi:hypothetical protein